MSKINLTNILAYLQGNIRYRLYYSRFKFMIRAHILEQIDFRIRFMKKECYENGQCVLCGCATTALQMADKACDAPCYPPIMGRGDWHYFKKGFGTYYKGDNVWIYTPPMSWHGEEQDETLLFYHNLRSTTKIPDKTYLYPNTI